MSTTLKPFVSTDFAVQRVYNTLQRLQLCFFRVNVLLEHDVSGCHIGPFLSIVSWSDRSFLDIWVDEVEKLGLMDAEKTGEARRQFLDRLRLVVETQTKSTCKPVRLRAKETLADDRLPWNAVESGDDEVGKSAKNDSGDKDSWDGFDD